VKSGLEGCGWRGAIGDCACLVVRGNGAGGDSWVGVVSSEALAVQSPRCSRSPVVEKWEDKNGVGREGCRR